MNQTSSLHIEGYVVLRGALSASACDALDASLRQFPMESRAKWGIKFAKNCLQQSPDLMRHLNVGGGSLMHEPHAVLYDEVVELEDTYAGTYGWHQDAIFFPAATLSISVALSALSGDQSGFAVVPGSHGSGLQPHPDSPLGPSVGDPSAAEVLDVLLDRGDILLIHPLLIHVMRPNRSNRLARLYSVVAGHANNGELA